MLFLLAALALPVQVLLRAAFGEPYPGLYQPSFGGVPEAGNVAITREPKITIVYDDGTRRRVKITGLLPSTPQVEAPIFRSAFYDPKRARDPETLKWIRERIERQSGREAEAMIVEWQRSAYNLRDRSRRVVATEKKLELDLTGAS